MAELKGEMRERMGELRREVGEASVQGMATAMDQMQVCDEKELCSITD